MSGIIPDKMQSIWNWPWGAKKPTPDIEKLNGYIKDLDGIRQYFQQNKEERRCLHEIMDEKDRESGRASSPHMISCPCSKCSPARLG